MRPIERADLCFISPQPDTSLHCQTTDTGLVYRAVCLFTSQRSWYSWRLPKEGWPGWVDLGGWLHTRMVYPSADSHALHPSTNRTWRRLTSLMRPMALPIKPNRHWIEAGYKNLEEN